MVEKKPLTKEEAFLDRLNTDAAFRNKFLDDPVGTLRKANFSLDPEDEKKVETSISYLKNDIKHIFEIPSGSSKFLKTIGFELKMPPRIEIKPEIKNI